MEDPLAVLQEPELRRDAVRALAAFDDPRVAETLLSGYGRWSGPDRQAAILTLTSRQRGAAQLLAALKAGTIARADLSAYAARQMQRVLGPSFVDF